MGLVWLALMPFTQGVSRRGFALVTLDNFRTVLHSTFYLDLVWQTLLMSAGAATCVMALTVVAGWLAVRRRPGAWLLDQLATAPLIFPGIVLGVAMIQIYLTVPVAIYGTLWAFILAFTIRFLPYGMRYAASGILQIHPELEEAAAIAGSPLRTALRRIVVPLATPALLAGWLFILSPRAIFRSRDSSLAVGAAGVGGDVRPVGQRSGHRACGVRPGLDGDHDGDRRRLLSHWAADHRFRRSCVSGECCVDLEASKKKVKALTEPRNAVLVGANDRPGSWAWRVLRNLKQYDFPQPLYLVNPRRTEIGGDRCYPDFKSLPEPPDHPLCWCRRRACRRCCAAAPRRGRAAPRCFPQASARPTTPTPRRLAASSRR